MEQVLDLATSWPTSVPTTALMVVVIYWLSVVLGALDLDILGGGADADVDGAVDALGHGHAHAGDAHAADAHGHGDGTDGGHDHGHGHEASHAQGLLNFLPSLGLRRVPMTVTVSLITVFTWTQCVIAMHNIEGFGDGTPHPIIGGAVLLAALVVSLILTAIAITPIAPIFATQEAKRRRDYVGRVCMITTGQVTNDFGQANLEDGGDVLIFPVRCDQQDNGLARNHKALVIDYDDQRDAYIVEPVGDMLPASKEG